VPHKRDWVLGGSEAGSLGVTKSLGQKPARRGHRGAVPPPALHCQTLGQGAQCLLQGFHPTDDVAWKQQQQRSVSFDGKVEVRDEHRVVHQRTARDGKYE
jgi:hypothetical protein